MKRGGEGSPKWKRNKRLNSRLFFNIHLIYNQKVKTIHRVNSKPLSLSLFLSKFQNLRTDATLGTRFHLSESVSEEIPSPGWFVMTWKRSTIFSEAIHGEMKKKEKERERDRERTQGGSTFHFPYKFNYDKRRETSRARETHAARTKKNTPRAK